MYTNTCHCACQKKQNTQVQTQGAEQIKFTYLLNKNKTQVIWQVRVTTKGCAATEKKSKTKARSIKTSR